MAILIYVCNHSGYVYFWANRKIAESFFIHRMCSHSYSFIQHNSVSLLERGFHIQFQMSYLVVIMLLNRKIQFNNLNWFRHNLFNEFYLQNECSYFFLLLFHRFFFWQNEKHEMEYIKLNVRIFSPFHWIEEKKWKKKTKGCRLYLLPYFGSQLDQVWVKPKEFVICSMANEIRSVQSSNY